MLYGQIPFCKLAGNELLFDELCMQTAGSGMDLCGKSMESVVR